MSNHLAHKVRGEWCCNEHRLAESEPVEVGSVGTRFDGADYLPKRDDPRLSGQLGRIFALMQDGGWRTLGEIAAMTGDPQPSISAQLRHLRKRRFGSHVVERRHLGRGLYQYRLLVRVST